MWKRRTTEKSKDAGKGQTAPAANVPAKSAADDDMWAMFSKMKAEKDKSTGTSEDALSDNVTSHSDTAQDGEASVGTDKGISVDLPQQGGEGSETLGKEDDAAPPASKANGEVSEGLLEEGKVERAEEGVGELVSNGWESASPRLNDAEPTPVAEVISSRDDTVEKDAAACSSGEAGAAAGEEPGDKKGTSAPQEPAAEQLPPEDAPKPKPPVPARRKHIPTEDDAARIIQRRFLYYRACKVMKKRRKNQKDRLNTFREIVETERKYVATLRAIVDTFLVPLRQLCKTSKPIVSGEDIKTLFGSVEVILNFSEHLKQRLEERLEEWKALAPGKQMVADIFLEMASYSKIYVSYVSNYETAVALCSKLRKKSDAFAEWEKEGLRKAGGGANSLSFLLVTPVQRIPRYMLLVDNLLKATWANHPDVEDLRKALDSIREIAAHVDQRTEEAERMQKISDIEDTIGGKFESLRDAKRRYVMEGELGVISSNKGKIVKNVRYFFLFNDLLVSCKYAASGSLRRGSLRGKKKANLLFEYKSRSILYTDEKLSVLSDRSNSETVQNAFNLDTPTTSFCLSASNPDVKKKWMVALQAVIDDLAPKVQFKQDVAKKVSTEKAKRARALIAQQYATLRVHGQRPETTADLDELASGLDDGGAPATPRTSTTRKFRSRRQETSNTKLIESASKAEENIQALEEEERKMKEDKDRERKRNLTEMEKLYTDETSGEESNSRVDKDGGNTRSKGKKKKRNIPDFQTNNTTAGRMERTKSQSDVPRLKTETEGAPRTRNFKRRMEERTPR
eukprot:CAMPEP_0119130410 /NCGR_PEP_ID=MMETSP1310-20130426/7761_1 /TAXON_ID=464262 /ORGANISM="Genus nov. species nov., Strain RCC2339" /LENGTH=794 /DNA_ID=CAMNT_0007120915 /DNA_START=57 /DNA_END=2441 /DNA_ORIENTATION=-